MSQAADTRYSELSNAESVPAFGIPSFSAPDKPVATTYEKGLPMSRNSRIAAKIAGLALAATAPLLAGAGLAQASAVAPAPDLDVTKCQVVRDHTNWGDGINWYHFNVTYTNEGNAPSGPFRGAAQPVWSTHGVFQNGNEVREEFDSLSLAPGQTVNRHYWLTEKVVNQKTWGIFLDINNQVPDSQKNDNFCSAWVNNS